MTKFSRRSFFAIVGLGALSASAAVADDADSTAGQTEFGYGSLGFGEEGYGGVWVGPPALPGLDNRPRDLDGDQLYEDVTGDGELTRLDAEALAAHITEPEVIDYAEYYDFIGNGRVSFADVVELGSMAAEADD